MLGKPLTSLCDPIEVSGEDGFSDAVSECADHIVDVAGEVSCPPCVTVGQWERAVFYMRT